jgi:hypothetical protein
MSLRSVATAGRELRLRFCCKRPSVAASRTPTKAYVKAVHSPGPIPIYVCGLILLAPLCTFIHRSAWKEKSANFAITEFYEVRYPQAMPKQHQR